MTERTTVVSGHLMRFLNSCIAIPFFFVLVASPAETVADIIHNYEFSGNLSDSIGGVTLIPNGGTVTSSEYQFLANQGLALQSPRALKSYTLAMRFRFSDVSDFRKAVDFKNLTSDDGLYVSTARLELYGVSGAGPGGAFAANVFSVLALTRNDSTKNVIGYVNGVKQWEFTDNDEVAVPVFTSGKSTFQFFKDDGETLNEASAGAVDWIKVYDAPLSMADIAGLSTSVPEPGVVMICGLVSGWLAVRCWRRRHCSNCAA
jgi:hypothetical protein